MTLEKKRTSALFAYVVARADLATIMESVPNMKMSTSLPGRLPWYVAFVLGFAFSILSFHATAQSVPTKDLSGYWQTGSGAIYQFFQKGPYVLAIYLKPSQGQLDSGIKSGDLAYEGNLIGTFVTGQFHHRFPLTTRAKCPANWYSVTTLTLTTEDGEDTMGGDLLNEHQTDSCEMDDRRFDHLVFKRTPKPAGVTGGSEQTPATKSRIVAWKTSG
jgi:hypothetical protein